MVLGRKTIANRLSRYVLLISAGLLLVVTLLVGIFSREIIEGGRAWTWPSAISKR